MGLKYVGFDKETDVESVRREGTIQISDGNTNADEFIDMGGANLLMVKVPTGFGQALNILAAQEEDAIADAVPLHDHTSATAITIAVPPEDVWLAFTGAEGVAIACAGKILLQAGGAVTGDEVIEVVTKG